MGAPIDTEGKSFSIWAKTKLSEATKIDYSIQNLLINETAWSEHRLSAHKQEGWIFDIGTSWNINSLNIRGNVSYQNLNLEKINSSKGFTIGLKTQYTF